MRASILAIVASALLGVAALGCGHAEQQRQAQEYERFLKDALGTVEPDVAPTPAQHAQAGRAVDRPAAD
jgi:hypothetical protein